MKESKTESESNEILEEHLKDLLSKTNLENRHEEINFGIEGKELI